MAPKKQTATKKSPKKETAEANDSRKSVKPPKTMKIEFIVSPLQRFRLAYGVGEKVDIDSNQAQELIDSGYAKKV